MSKISLVTLSECSADGLIAYEYLRVSGPPANIYVDDGGGLVTLAPLFLRLSVDLLPFVVVVEVGGSKLIL